MKQTTHTQYLASLSCPAKGAGRRAFLHAITAGLAGVPFVLHAAEGGGGGHVPLPTSEDARPAEGIDLGSGDTGILNYAYLLESLEAEYYTLVMKNPYAGMSKDEAHVLADIRDHEIVHREFFRHVLGKNAIPRPQFTFAKVNFADRTSVLTTARTFEDLGVAAYNGAGASVKDPNVLVTAGKIVSVEARHAAVLRGLLNPGSHTFAPTGFDDQEGSASVLRKAKPYLVTPVNASHLPC